MRDSAFRAPHLWKQRCRHECSFSLGVQTCQRTIRLFQNAIYSRAHCFRRNQWITCYNQFFGREDLDGQSGIGTMWLWKRSVQTSYEIVSTTFHEETIQCKTIVLSFIVYHLWTRLSHMFGAGTPQQWQKGHPGFDRSWRSASDLWVAGRIDAGHVLLRQL